MDVTGVRFYSDPEWLPPGVEPITLLFPFWGMPPEDPNDPRSGAYDTWNARGRELVSLTALDEAELVVLPFDFRETDERPELLPIVHRAAERASAARKPFVIFYWHDSAAPVPLPGAIVFRTSIEKGPRYGVTEFCMPGWMDDPLVRWAGGDPRIPPEKPARSRISFCGFTAPLRDSGARLRSVAKEQARRALGARHTRVPRLSRTPLELRRRALDIFERSADVDTTFLQRADFYDGAASRRSEADYARKTKARREYVENMLESDYVLCIRGAGNFSHRYFDTLACAKMPILIDTGGAVPYDFFVDWRSRGPWIPVDDLYEAPAHVRAFHDALSDADFQRLGRENRAWFERWLTPEGFFLHFRLHLERFPRT